MFHSFVFYSAKELFVCASVFEHLEKLVHD
jgi:hypothetical protein